MSDTSTKTPKVSVCVMTYNQEEYIAQCLQSIVDQKTDFDFEVIVGDDCSTDGTREIIRKFANKYPDKIKTLLHDKNIGVTNNYKEIHDAATGEYVAHCDGDDYWLPGKLQYQSNLLDKNPEISQCWTCANLVDDDGKKIGIFPSRLARILYPSIITARDIALSYALVGQHSTQMYRRKFKFNIKSNEPLLDYWIAFNIALNGPAIYSKEVFSNYRITKTPSMTRSKNDKRVTVDFLAIHLTNIIQTQPKLAKTAKANMTARRFFSKIRGHNLDKINKEIEKNQNVSAGIFGLMKSSYYFLLQKISI